MDAIKGEAELPVLEELINIPYGGKFAIEILNKEEQIISFADYGFHNLVFPSQPSLSKSEDPENVPFYFNSSYYQYDEFHESDIVKIKMLEKMRGQQLARISIVPFKHNPSTNQLKIVTKLEVKVVFNSIDIEAHKANYQRYYSAEFDYLYKSCLNYIPLQKKDVITTYPVKYVIVADPIFQAAFTALSGVENA